MEKTPKEVFEFDEQKLMRVGVNEVRPNTWNPKRKDNKEYEKVKESVQVNGLTQPIFVRENDNGETKYEILDGEHRHRAAKELGLEYIYIYNEGVVDDNLARSLTLWHEVSVSMDEDMLRPLVMELNKAGVEIPFNDLEVEMETEPEVEEDDFDTEGALEDIVEPFTKKGDVIHLGEHRLLCGDSTSLEDTIKLMNGTHADCLITDPPYNVAVSNSQGMTIQNDNMSSEDFIEFLDGAMSCASSALKKGGAFYVWFGDSEDVAFRQACNKNGLTVKQCLIWVKNSLNMGRQDYQWKHEPCLYGWKDGASHYFVDDRTQETVIEDKPNINKMDKNELKAYIRELWEGGIPTTIIRENKPFKNIDHPTMKPIKLIAREVRNSSRKGELVLDMFGGSGSTLIACEQLERKCYMMELDPKYCDVIIKRWQTLTGNSATVERDGQEIPFES